MLQTPIMGIQMELPGMGDWEHILMDIGIWAANLGFTGRDPGMGQSQCL